MIREEFGSGFRSGEWLELLRMSFPRMDLLTGIAC